MTQFIHGSSIKNTLKFLSLFLFLSLSFNSQAAEDLLAPEKAFALKAWIENNQVIAEVDIADKYYLYRDSFSFTTDTGGVEFGAPTASDGKIKNDEFFGEVEVYRKTARVTLPLIYNGLLKPSAIVIKTSMQGCADVGVCYPPLYQSLTMDTDSKAIVLPVAYQYKSEPKQKNIATESLQSMDNILSQLTDTLNKNSVSNTLDSAKKSVAPVIDPIVEPIKNLVSNDKKPEEKSSSLNALSLLQSFGDDLGLTQEDEIPSPDKAFQLSAELDANNIIQTSIEIYPTTYLYKDKVKIKIVNGNGHETGAVSLPKGDQKHDEFFGDIVVFHDQVKTSIPIITNAHASSQFVLSYGYQGCVEDKICYPPITKFLLVDLNDKSILISDEQPTINSAISNSSNAKQTIQNANAVDQQYYDSKTNGSGEAGAPDAAPTEMLSSSAINSTSSSSTNDDQTEQGRFASIIADGNIILIIGSFFLAGLLLTFTPCVFPMIPILSGIIAGQGDNITTKKAFTLSLVYVIAMASTYAIAGYVMGKFGAEYNITAWMQDPIILSVFAGIFVLLSLSMFGFYDIQMPGFIQSRLTEFSNKQKGGELVGVGIMGSLSALIVGPCITAPLVGALLFISQTQDPQLGALALFALGLGMGVPLLIIGTSAGKFLPKAGTWMDAVKAVFGVSLLAVAIWMLSRFLASEIIMTMIATLMIVYGVYIASAPIKENSSGWARIGKGIGFILTLYGSFYLVGMAAGGKDLVQPLKGIIKVTSGSSSSTQNDGHLIFQQIKGEQGLADALKQHKGKVVMLDFYADWCISCLEMEKYAFADPAVLNALKDVAAIQTDVTDNDKQDQLFMSSLNIYGPPAILFYDRNGVEVPNTRVVGEMSGEEFAAHVIKVLAKIK